MAIFCHFLTFLVTFSAAVIPFMHKTCAERTKTFLTHRTTDEATFFFQFQAPIQASRAPKMAIFWPNPDQMDQGGSRLGQSTWKGPDVPYHIPIDGKV